MCCHTSKSKDIRSLLFSVGKALMKKCHEPMEQYGITPVRYFLLKSLSRGDNVPLSELSERMGCSCSNITGLVDRIEKDGLVVRERNGEDRRVIRLKITKEGKRFMEKLPDPEKEFSSALNSLSKSEQKELVRLLTKLQEGLE